MQRTKDTLIIDFEWHSLLRDILRNLWLVLLAVLMGLMGVYIVSHSIYKPQYKSSATLVVRTKNNTNTAYSNLSSSSEMAEIYGNVFIQPAMKVLAAENLAAKEAAATVQTGAGTSSANDAVTASDAAAAGDDVTSSETSDSLAAYDSSAATASSTSSATFVGSVSVELLTETNIMTIYVTTDSPELSYKELKSILEVYPQISESIFADSVIDIVKQPMMPRSPCNQISTNRVFLVIALCALAVLAGIIIISLLRDTVKSENDFHKKIDARLIGSISHERYNYSRISKRSMIISEPGVSLNFIESHRKLATKLEHLNRKYSSKVFLFTSVASQEYKTTTAINTAIVLASRGHKVLLMDMDFMKPSIAGKINITINGQNDLISLMNSNGNLSNEEGYRYKKSNLYLMFVSDKHKNHRKLLEENSVHRFIEKCRDHFEYIIIDSAPMCAAADTSYLIKSADKTLMVVRTDRALASDINDSVLSINELGGDFAGCIITDVFREMSFFGMSGSDANGYMGNYGYGSYRKYSSYYKYNGSSMNGYNDTL